MEGAGTPFGSQLQLVNKNGYFIKVTPCGEVCGTDELDCPYTYLQILSGGDVGLVRLQGMETNLYVCFDPCGQLYGEFNPENSGTIFKEELLGSYNSYKSMCYPEWYIGIKKNGTVKPGHRTAIGQKATKFLPKRF